ncbi:MAG: hypothetical protein JWM41_480 [Gemmatimonadetes bacterium]|nr:hypothetical protein [Gemmatimonadota bacterium]
MPNHVARLAACALAFASGLLLLAVPAAAQHTGTPASDTSWIVPRAPLAQARNSLRTRDAQAAVLLMDTTLVLQFTDTALSRMNASVRDSAPQDFAHRLAARMVGSALSEMFDHGIAYNLRALRGARVEGNRLVLEDLAGKRVFDRVELNGRDVMNDFSPAEASRFAAAVNQALRR